MYDLIEHRHRFSVWAAARAAQRGLKGGKVDVLRDALEQSGVAAYVKAGPGSVDQRAFEEVHRTWCRSIIKYLATRGVSATFGRAAKLIAIYIKSMIVLGGHDGTELAHIAHPPIDGILMCNLRNAVELQSKRRTSWAKVKWTKLSEDEYYRLIDELRLCIPQHQPFWTLEQFWTVTEDRAD
jgi:hypothetical protein